MLLLGSRTITIEGITIFPDHADPDQFWYLPGPVQLARRDGRPHSLSLSTNRSRNRRAKAAGSSCLK
ncbi:hypothetical protein [Cohnella faecalis]|uniref:hypothetical protein n=1 Tax=Cohnella faecalis TaxID=2315694 RepID=UPI0011C217A2|nr:hypothetical protein [Cohnella faecalis]